MTDIMDQFSHLTNKTQMELMQRYDDLKSSAPMDKLPDEVLQELLAINRILRGRATAPKTKSGSRAAPAPSLGQL